MSRVALPAAARTTQSLSLRHRVWPTSATQKLKLTCPDRENLQACEFITFIPLEPKRQGSEFSCRIIISRCALVHSQT